MKIIRTIALATALLLAFSVVTGCGGSGSGGGATTTAAATTAATTAAAAATTAAETAAAAPAGDGEKQTPQEGKDTNYGRPYNLSKVAYDSRDPKYLNGINATILPIVDEPLTISIWQQFSSTVMTELNESEVYKEMAKRTNININWMHPPQDQARDNYNLLISSNNLPHIFSRPPGDAYPGGPAKAIDDGVYIELTPYYNKGLMPNIEFIMHDRPDIARDYVDDNGRYLAFIMLDIVPTHPWSGLWVRKDWIDDLGLAEPATIDDWDTMLRAMQESKTPTPLFLNIKDWYGVATNYMFSAAYDTGYGYINKNGKVEYGPVNEGFLPFLNLLNGWYADGLIDPDFVTRTHPDYISNTINGVYGAIGMAYGDVGQLKLSGSQIDPKFKLVPVLQPTSYDGQVTHLRQENAIARTARDYMTAKAVDDGIDETIVRYIDYWFSQDGGDLCSYGPEGVSYVWNDKGTFEYIYPDLVDNPDSDFWTLFPRFKLHEGPYLRDSSSYENEQEVWDCIELWATQDASYVMPDNITHTSDEARELAEIEADINTYREEMVARFVTGQSPLSEYAAFVEQMKSLKIDRAIELKQAALDRYYKR